MKIIEQIFILTMNQLMNAKKKVVILMYLEKRQLNL